MEMFEYFLEKTKSIIITPGIINLVVHGYLDVKMYLNCQDKRQELTFLADSRILRTPSYANKRLRIDYLHNGSFFNIKIDLLT
jgi:hypothetical protein